MAEKKEKLEEREYKVEIVRRNFITVYPRLREKHWQVISVYREEALPTGSVTIDLYELFKDKQEDAVKQIRARKGPLFERYLREEAKFIRADIEERLAERPEVVTV